MVNLQINLPILFFFDVPKSLRQLWGTWSEWSDCTKQCNGGQKMCAPRVDVALCPAKMADSFENIGVEDGLTSKWNKQAYLLLMNGVLSSKIGVELW